MSFLETLRDAPVCTLRRECFSPPRGPPCSLTCSHSARGSQVRALLPQRQRQVHRHSGKRGSEAEAVRPFPKHFPVCFLVHED